MSGSKPVRPPWWLKPANKVVIQMSRLGMSFGGESPVVLTVPGQARLARGRNVRWVNMVELSTDDARPLLRVFPTEVPPVSAS